MLSKILYANDNARATTKYSELQNIFQKSKVRFMVVSLYAALLTIIYIALSVHVIRGRWFYRISLNDGGNEAMNRRIRAHGNFSEYVPLFLIILGLAEHNGMPAYAVHILGCLFILGRLLHAYNLLDLRENKPHLFFRSAGVVLTINYVFLNFIKIHS